MLEAPRGGCYPVTISTSRTPTFRLILDSDVLCAPLHMDRKAVKTGGMDHTLECDISRYI